MSDYVLEKINDYNENLSLFLTQFQDSTKLNGIMTAAYNRANDIETALFEIRDEMGLDNAIGVQLDILGKVFSEDRQGRNDTNYRLAIQQKASTIYSGEPEALIVILKNIYGATYAYYGPLYPGKYYINTDAAVIGSDILPFSLAGVNGFIGLPLEDETEDTIVDADGEEILILL